MSHRRHLWLLLPEPVRRVPADLGGAMAMTALVNAAVFLPAVRETPLRIVVGLPFVLFVPGYVFVAALFPEDGGHRYEDDESGTVSWESGSGIDGIERVALSFGLSIAVVPLVGLALNFTPWGIRLLPIMVSVSAFVLAATGVGAYRRWQLPVDERFRVPYRSWFAAARADLFAPDTRADAALNVVLALSVLAASGSVGYAVVVPQDGERFTEFYLLTETDDGELVADDYPTEFAVGENRSVIVGIANREHERTDYTVVVQLQRVRIENNSTSVARSERLDSFEQTLGHNETWHYNHSVTPTYEGEQLRLLYLLYRGNAPAEPRLDNAYREAHLWVNVSSA